MPASFPPPAQNLFNGVTTQAAAMASLGLTAANAFGLVVGNPTGGNKGVGTINATGVYVNGTAVGGGLTVPNSTLLGGNGTILQAVTAIDGLVIGGVTPKAGTFTSIGASNTNITQLANPAAPTVTNVGTAGSTTNTYGIIAVFADGTTSGLGAVTTNATSNATLNGTNYNTISWTAISGSANYQIWRTTAGGTPNTIGLIGTVAAGTTTFNDTGLAGNTATAPTWNNTGVIYMNGTPIFQLAMGYRGTSFVPDPENTFVGFNAGGGTSVSALCIEATSVGYLSGGGQSTGNVGNRNTSMGYGALSYVTAGASNVAIGNNSMYGELVGQFNTMVGADVARFAIGCSESTGIGAQAFYNTVPTNSIAIGFQALLGQAGATSSQNVVVANNGLCSAALVAPVNNVVIGFNVANGSGLTSPLNNTMVGTVILSGTGVAAPTFNVLMGSSVLTGNSVVTPGSNVMIGNNIANSAAISPTQNTFVGHTIASTLTTGSGNVSIGVFSSRALTSGGGNTVIGNSALDKLNTGSNNLCIGNAVGSTTLATGSSNILIGTSSAVDTPLSSTSSYLNIGNVLLSTGLASAATAIVASSFGLGVGGTAGPTWTSGAGVPASTQPAGSMYSNTSGGTGTRLYVSSGGGTWLPVAGV